MIFIIPFAFEEKMILPPPPPSAIEPCVSVTVQQHDVAHRKLRRKDIINAHNTLASDVIQARVHQNNLQKQLVKNRARRQSLFEQRRKYTDNIRKFQNAIQKLDKMVHTIENEIEKYDCVQHEWNSASEQMAKQSAGVCAKLLQLNKIVLKHSLESEHEENNIIQQSNDTIAPSSQPQHQPWVDGVTTMLQSMLNAPHLHNQIKNMVKAYTAKKRLSQFFYAQRKKCSCTIDLQTSFETYLKTRHDAFAKKLYQLKNIA